MRKFVSFLTVVLAVMLFVGCKYELEVCNEKGAVVATALVDYSSGVLEWNSNDGVDFTGYKFIIGDSVSEINNDGAVIMYKNPNDMYRVEFDSFTSKGDDDEEIKMTNIVISEVYSGDVVAEYAYFNGVNVPEE